MFRAASGASAIVRTMFGDDERPRLGQIEHLPDAVDVRLIPVFKADRVWNAVTTTR